MYVLNVFSFLRFLFNTVFSDKVLVIKMILEDFLRGLSVYLGCRRYIYLHVKRMTFQEVLSLQSWHVWQTVDTGHLKSYLYKERQGKK